MTALLGCYLALALGGLLGLPYCVRKVTDAWLEAKEAAYAQRELAAVKALEERVVVLERFTKTIQIQAAARRGLGGAQ